MVSYGVMGVSKKLQRVNNPEVVDSFEIASHCFPTNFKLPKHPSLF